MTEVRIQDRVFLAALIPAALCAAYFWGWRIDTAKDCATLEARSATLVRAEDFAAAKARALRECAAAEQALEKERKVPEPRLQVKADPATGVAARDRAAQAAFRAAGLAVTRSAPQEGKEAPLGTAALAATGTRPAPVARAYELEGAYPALLGALADFAQREAAVVPERVSLATGRGVPAWSLILGL